MKIKRLEVNKRRNKIKLKPKCFNDVDFAVF